MAKAKTTKEVLAVILKEAEKLGGNLRIRDCRAIYDLCGEYEAKFTKAAGSPQKIMYLACEMAHDALMAERARVVDILHGIETEDTQIDDEWAKGWRSAADAARVELLDIQPGPEWMTANDN